MRLGRTWGTRRIRPRPIISGCKQRRGQHRDQIEKTRVRPVSVWGECGVCGGRTKSKPPMRRLAVPGKLLQGTHPWGPKGAAPPERTNAENPTFARFAGTNMGHPRTLGVQRVRQPLEKDKCEKPHVRPLCGNEHGTATLGPQGAAPRKTWRERLVFSGLTFGRGPRVLRRESEKMEGTAAALLVKLLDG